VTIGHAIRLAALALTLAWIGFLIWLAWLVLA
jgi:hypothetical protein